MRLKIRSIYLIHAFTMCDNYQYEIHAMITVQEIFLSHIFTFIQNINLDVFISPTESVYQINSQYGDDYMDNFLKK